MRVFISGYAGAGFLIIASACTAKPVPDTDSSPVVSQSVPCAPVLGRLPQGATTGALAGDYDLTLVATAGARSGRDVTGRMTIAPTQGSNGSRAGTATISLDDVGATAPGQKPADGRYEVTALPWQSNAGSQITIRFGSISAPAGTQVIEGPYMALQVATMEQGTVAGGWASGAGDPALQGSSGHFCARQR